ncbi:MAG: flavodoxin domain-containing protein [Coriobacteriia bacterium]|nr:flavodoxin domain-containing protein [Coriobacteriia bacterium]
MKTLILYSTKHGSTAVVAQHIASGIDDTVMHDLKKGEHPVLADFDCIIVGSAIYAGKILEQAQLFLAQNTAMLCSKRLGLFLCGMGAEAQAGAFTANFSPELLDAARAIAFLGGVFDPAKASFFERLIMRAVGKMSSYTDIIDDNAISRFTAEMRE